MFNGVATQSEQIPSFFQAFPSKTPFQADSNPSNYKMAFKFNPDAIPFIPSAAIDAAVDAAAAANGGAGAPQDVEDILDNYSVVTDLSADEDFRFPVPVAPIPVPAAVATRAFIRIFHNDEELKLSLDYVNGLEMEELEFAIRGLTAQFLGPKPAPGAKGPKPKKKFYDVNVCCTYVRGLDDFFKRRFGNPDKKWLLRMGPGGRHGRKWGKVEVSFILH
jgi:hypothetical protein